MKLNSKISSNMRISSQPILFLNWRIYDQATYFLTYSLLSWCIAKKKDNNEPSYKYQSKFVGLFFVLFIFVTTYLFDFSFFFFF